MQYLKSTAARFAGLGVAILLLTLPQPAMAYVGPGSGLTVIGAALAFLGGIFLAIVGFIWYPLKRWLRARDKSAAEDG